MFLLLLCRFNQRNLFKRQQQLHVRKIDLHFRDPKPEAEDRIADRVAAHILTQQNTAWTNAVHLRDIQRLWELHLHEIAQWVPGKQKKTDSGRGQVRLTTQRRKAAAPVAQTVGLLARQVDTASQPRSSCQGSGCCAIESGAFVEQKCGCPAQRCCMTHFGRLYGSTPSILGASGSPGS